jgi:hypothetical protein
MLIKREEEQQQIKSSRNKSRGIRNNNQREEAPRIDCISQLIFEDTDSLHPGKCIDFFLIPSLFFFSASSDPKRIVPRYEHNVMI